MKTVSCDELIRHPDGIVEIRYSENGVESGAITFGSEADFEAWLGGAERLSPRELAELHVAEALRNTPEPAKTPDSVTPSDVPEITTGDTVPVKQNVVRIDDYRNPPMDSIDAAIDSVNIRINALIKSKMAKDANDLLVLEQIAAADEELAITLLLLD